MPPHTQSSKPRGPKPSIRHRLAPQFLDAIRASGQPIWLLALRAGFPHLQTLSPLLHADVPATPLNLERLGRLAESIGFPRDQIFLDEVAD